MPSRKSVPSAHLISETAADQSLSAPIVSKSSPRRRPPARKKKVVPVSPVITEPNFVVQEAEEASFNPSPQFYRKIAITFLGLAIILVLVVVFFTSGSAEIQLILKPKNIKVDTNLNVVPQASQKNQISGNLTSLTLQEEKIFAVSGGGSPVIGIATGKVIVYNKRPVAQSLVATTRLLSPTNILFRLKRGITIPANGQSEVEVYSDKSGAESEIEATNFTIPGLSADLQKLVYAESKEKMLGGVKYSKVLTDEDVKNAATTLANDLFQKGQDQLKFSTTTVANYSTSFFNLAKQIFKTDSKVGATVENFKISVSIEVVGVFFNTVDVNKYLSEQLRSSLADYEVLNGAPEKPVIELASYDLVKKTADLHLVQTATAGVSYLEDVIDKNNILGKNKSEAEQYLKTLPWIEKIEIKTRPSWLKKIPSEMSKVKIKISQ